MPVTRLRAEQMVQNLPSRAAAMNADPRYIYEITKLAVFGSYLRDKALLGDVDVACELQFRMRHEERRAAFESFDEHFPPPVYIRQNYFEHLCWPQSKMRRDLKAGRGMHIHEFGELAALGCPYQLIFELENEPTI